MNAASGVHSNTPLLQAEGFQPTLKEVLVARKIVLAGLRGRGLVQVVEVVVLAAREA